MTMNVGDQADNNKLFANSDLIFVFITTKSTHVMDGHDFFRGYNHLNDER